MEKVETSSNKKSIILKIFLIVGLLVLMTLFTGCSSADKSKAGCATSKDMTFSYDETSDTTRIDFALHFENNSIYDLTKENFEFLTYKENRVMSSRKFSLNIIVKSHKVLETNTYIIVAGQVDQLKLLSFDPSFDSLWNSYKVWWIIIIVAPIVLALIYMFVILFKDLNLSDVFESVETWVFMGLMLVPTIISPFINGTKNWFLLIICLIGIAATVLLCLAMSGIKALLDIKNANPFKKYRDKEEKIKEENYYKKLADYIKKYGADKGALNKLDKSSLEYYCNRTEINASGTKKADLVDAICAFCGGNVSVSANKEGSKKKIGQGLITFNDIAGLDQAKEVFKEKVVLPFEHPELYKKYGKKAGGGILLYGLPGTGKTMFAEASSNEVDALFIPIKCSDIKSKWYGESEQKIKEIFKKAREAKKAIIFFDEFEAIGSKRTEDSNDGNNSLVPEILAEMQGVGTALEGSTIVVIAATNKPWLIDSAFLRPGRFDEKIYIPLPDLKARIRLFEIKLKGVPVYNLNLEELAKLTDGFNGADITEFCEKLKMQAINQSIEKGKEHIITMEDAIAVSRQMKSSVTNEDIQKLKDFENK